MNILIMTKENNGGGLVTHVINLANTLQRKGHNVYVVGPLNGKDNNRFDELECCFIPISLATKNPMTFIKNINKLKKLVKEKQIDIIHTHNRIPSIYANIIKMQMGIPFVWTLHLNNIPSNPIAKALTFYGDKAIVVSSDLMTFCEKKLGIPADDITVGYNGVYEEEYRVYDEEEKRAVRRKYGIKEGEKVFTILSRLDPVKGHKVMINAVEQVPGEYSVIFTGESLVPGYKEELKSLIQQKGMEEKFKFVGYVNPVEVLNISDLFVLPSENEGFPISIIEAFLLRVPVVRTTTAGYNDTKEFVIPMNNENDLAIILTDFMKGSLNLNEMVEKGYRFAMENCTCNAMAEKVLNIYREAIT